MELSQPAQGPQRRIVPSPLIEPPFSYIGTLPLLLGPSLVPSIVCLSNPQQTKPPTNTTHPPPAMPPTSNFFRASRPVFRAGFTASQARNAFGRTGGFRQNAGRRFQSTTADDAAAAKASWFKRMWDSPIGLKTVHFW